MGMVASPACGKAKLLERACGKASLRRAGQGEPSTKPTPDVQFGMHHTAHVQLPAHVLCKC